MTRPKRTRSRGRGGAAALELALALPLVLTLVLGGIDYGRFSHTHITVTNAARSGAEFGATHPYTTATRSLWEEQIRLAVRDEAAGLDRFDPAALDVAITTVEADGEATRVAVGVAYPFRTVMDWPVWPRESTLRRVVSMPMTRP